MFGIGMTEVLLILAVALVILGPKKLPELAKTLGKAFGEFKRSVNDLKSSIDIEVEDQKTSVDLKELNNKKTKVPEDE